MGGRATITFLPGEQRITANPGSTLLEAALDAGFFLPAHCGGSGTCGGCAVKLTGNAPKSPESLGVLGRKKYDRGFRLACAVEITGDMTVELPAPAAGQGGTARPSAQGAGAVSRIRAVEEVDRAGRPSDPPCESFHIVMCPPSHSDNVSDLTRLISAVRKATAIDRIAVDLPLVRQIPRLTRELGWEVTVDLAHRGHDMTRTHLVRVSPGGRTRRSIGVACDIGTTTLWAALVDCTGQREVARGFANNPQRAYGADVISRIIYAATADGMGTLTRAVVESLDDIIDDLLESTATRRESISHIVCAGNTVMSHFLLGLETKYLREAPYVPAAKVFPDVSARTVGFRVEQDVPLFVFPAVASYVGGDIVSGVLSSGFFRHEDITLFIDIGTNGEIVLGNREWLMTASTSAGPAFEGGGVRFGANAVPGAIEGFLLGDDFEPMVTTIGRRKPAGICGSGIINIVAGLFVGGALDQNGKIRTDLPTDRVRGGPSGTEYVVVRAHDTGIDEDIVISDVDIQNVMRAKAAMFAGYLSLMEKTGVAVSDIGRVIVSGAFGSRLDIESAVTIGLLPDIDRSRFHFIGNGSLAGAVLGCLSRSMFREGLSVAAGMTNVELSVDPGYMDRYLSSLFLPHTDIGLFPSVKVRTSGGREATAP